MPYTFLYFKYLKNKIAVTFIVETSAMQCYGPKCNWLLLLFISKITKLQNLYLSTYLLFCDIRLLNNKKWAKTYRLVVVIENEA